jgi:RNA polymerase sigma factor (sigma-70 family)
MTDDSVPVPVQARQPGHTDRADRVAILVSAAKQGSEVAFGELVNEFSPLLWQIARAAGLSSGDAEDVVQVVWLRLVEHLDEIRAPSALSGWLVITTKREAWRVRALERRQLPADQESFAELPDEGPGSEEQVIIDERRRALWAAIRQLPPRCQELLRIIAFVPRPDYAAIAGQLGLRVGSVGPTRGRCLARLRAVLADGLEEDAR